jgi:hypothetical protein
MVQDYALKQMTEEAVRINRQKNKIDAQEFVNECVRQYAENARRVSKTKD